MRSLLFVPGDSARKFDKARQGAADALIIDLEDSVALDRKDEARSIAAEMLSAERGLQQLFVRVNALDTGRTLADLAAVLPARPDGIMLPKCESADQLRHVGHWLDGIEAASRIAVGTTRIIAIATESAASIFGLGSYAGASERLAGLMWGAEDLAASLGATTNRAGASYASPYRLARDLCLMGAAAAGVAAIDTVYTDIEDLDGLAEEARAARRDGFLAKAGDPSETRRPSERRLHAERGRGRLGDAHRAGLRGQSRPRGSQARRPDDRQAAPARGGESLGCRRTGVRIRRKKKARARRARAFPAAPVTQDQNRLNL
jgi:citrate lyase subunit beta/citryl-CoA lyase